MAVTGQLPIQDDVQRPSPQTKTEILLPNLSPSTVASNARKTSSSSGGHILEPWPLEQAKFEAWRAYRGPLGWLRRFARGPLRLIGAMWSWGRLRCPFICMCVYVYSHLLIFSMTLRLVSIFLFPLLFEWASYWYFWARSIRQSYVLFRRAWRHSLAARQHIAELPVYHHPSPIVDRFITYWYRLLYSWSEPGSSTLHFRQFLSEVPPAFPLTSHDYFWLQDTRENSCQVIGLALIERMTIKRLQKVVKDRWINTEPKLTSRLTAKFGRYCWQALVRDDLGRSDIPYFPAMQTELPPTFNLSDHVFEMSIDLTQTTVYEALSALASETLSTDKPRWRIVLLNPVAEINSHTDDFSCLALQIHHGIGDGIAIAHAVIHKLFDPPSSKKDVALRPPTHTPTSTTPLIDTGRAALYYFWNAIKCAAFGVRVLGFWLVWCPKPPAIFQSGRGSCLAARRPAKGTKFLAPPVVLDMQEMQRLRASIKELSNMYPTVNDILAYCLTIVIDRLRSGHAVAELRAKMARRKAFGAEEGATPPLQTRFSAKHVVDGVPLDPIEFDLSTPTALQSTQILQRRRKPHVAIGGPDWHRCLREFVNHPDPSYHPHASNFEDFLQIMIPMATRTGEPTSMDNFTGPVLVRLPLLTYTKRVYAAEIVDWARSLARQFESASQARNLLVALRHLRMVKTEIDEMKRNGFGPVFFLLICLCCKVFPDMLSSRVVTAVNNRMVLLLTNVIGSPDPRCFIDGLKVSSIQFWPPAKGEVTGGVAVLSFGDRLQIFSVFDEEEFHDVFHSDQDYNSLTKHDRAAMAQFVGNLIKAEFKKLLALTNHALGAH